MSHSSRQLNPDKHFRGTCFRHAMLAVAVALALAGCASPTPTEGPTSPPQPTDTAVPPTEVPVQSEDTPVPEPTEIPEFDYLAVSALGGSPQDTPDGTYELYLRDAISQVVRLQREKVDMRAGYQAPELLDQDLNGLVVDVQLLEDRSTFTTFNADAVIYEGDFDLLVTYASQETRSTQCTWTVNLERTNDIWYVVNPTEFPIFVNCFF